MQAWRAAPSRRGPFPGIPVSSGRSKQDADYRVVLLAAYANRAADFEAGEADFDTFLAHLALGKGQRAHTCANEEAAPIPETSPEASPPPNE